MTKPYYELHITMKLRSPHLEAVEKYETSDGLYQGSQAIRKFTETMGWKFSAIDGDINLGDGVKLYATCQLNKRNQLDGTRAILDCMAAGLAGIGANVVRKKVEEVLIDERVSA